MPPIICTEGPRKARRPRRGLAARVCILRSSLGGGKTAARGLGRVPVAALLAERVDKLLEQVVGDVFARYTELQGLPVGREVERAKDPVDEGKHRREVLIE